MLKQNSALGLIATNTEARLVEFGVAIYYTYTFRACAITELV
jgi:hypothetical protein